MISYMRQVEAVLITSIIGLLGLPIIIIMSVFMFLTEIGFNIKELFSDDTFEKALVTKTLKNYYDALKKCYNKIANEKWVL